MGNKGKKIFGLDKIPDTVIIKDLRDEIKKLENKLKNCISKEEFDKIKQIHDKEIQKQINTTKHHKERHTSIEKKYEELKERYSSLNKRFDLLQKEMLKQCQK